MAGRLREQAGLRPGSAQRDRDDGDGAQAQAGALGRATHGEFDRHLRRMRPVYRRRRDALLAALTRHLPWLEPTGISAGLHLVTWLPPGLDEAAVVAAARRAGVGIDAVGPYRISHPGPEGLIFGYATVGEQAIAEGIEILARVIGQLRPDLWTARDRPARSDRPGPRPAPGP